MFYPRQPPVIPLVIQGQSYSACAEYFRAGSRRLRDFSWDGELSPMGKTMRVNGLDDKKPMFLPPGGTNPIGTSML